MTYCHHKIHLIQYVISVEKYRYTEYDKIFQNEEASLNIIRAEDEGLKITVDSLIKGGTIVGQRTMFDDDVILRMNPEKVYKPIPEKSLWKTLEPGVPVSLVGSDGGSMTTKL